MLPEYMHVYDVDVLQESLSYSTEELETPSRHAYWRICVTRMVLYELLSAPHHFLWVNEIKTNVGNMLILQIL